MHSLTQNVSAMQNAAQHFCSLSGRSVSFTSKAFLVHQLSDTTSSTWARKEAAKNLIGQSLANELLPFSVGREVTRIFRSLFYRYSLNRCSSVLSESVLKFKIFTWGSYRVSPLACYHVSHERNRTKSISNSFSVRTVQLWNQYYIFQETREQIPEREDF